MEFLGGRGVFSSLSVLNKSFLVFERIGLGMIVVIFVSLNFYFFYL